MNSSSSAFVPHYNENMKKKKNENKQKWKRKLEEKKTKNKTKTRQQFEYKRHNIGITYCLQVTKFITFCIKVGVCHG